MVNVKVKTTPSEWKMLPLNLYPPPSIGLQYHKWQYRKTCYQFVGLFSLHFQTYFIIKLLNGEVFLKICSIKPLKLFIHPSLPTTRALSLTGPDCVYWSLLHPWLASWICFRPLGCCWWFNFERWKLKQVQLSATKMITGLSIYTFLYFETRWTPLHVYALGARLWFYMVGNNSIVIPFWIISYFKSFNNEFSKLFFTVCIKRHKRSFLKKASHENIIEFNQPLNSIFFFKIGF